MYCIYELDGEGDEWILTVILVAFFVAGMVLFGLYTYSGWLLAHPLKGIRHRRAVGMVTLIIGVLLLISFIRVVIFDELTSKNSDPFFFTGFVVVILSMIIGGWLLTHPIKLLKGAQPPDEPVEQ